MSRLPTDRFPDWYAELERRHLQDLRFSEVRRALQALSDLYVSNRKKITRGSALDGTGKRAAFALFYGPLHFLMVRHILEALPPVRPYPGRILDLGCGTGAAGAAWAAAARGRPAVEGYDFHPWAVEEAEWTYERFRLKHRASRRDVSKVPMPGRRDALIAAWSVNEFREEVRAALLPRLVESAERGARILIVEPVAKGVTPWWNEWSGCFQAAGGQADEWSFRPALPESLRLLDRAARLDHTRYKARSLSLNMG